MGAPKPHVVWAIWASGCLPALPAAEKSIQVPPGFEARVLQESEVDCWDWATQGLQAIGFTPSGEPIVYEGGAVSILGETGRRTLAVLNLHYAEFIRLHPDGQSVYVGFDTTEVFRVRLDGSSWVLVDDALAGFPFDDDAGAYIDFAPTEVPVFGGMGFMASLGRRDDDGREAGIHLLDEDPSNVNHRIVRGYPCEAGALTFAPEGSLYFLAAHGEDCWAPRNIYRFSPEQVAWAVQGGPLGLADAEIVVTDMGNELRRLFWFSDLLYVVNGYGATPAAIVSLAPDEGFSPTPFHLAMDQVHGPELVAFHPGSLPFVPGAGKAGGKMLVTFDEFPCRSTLVEIVPKPPSPFLRGDANADGAADISDAVATLGFLFHGAPRNDCLDAADLNDDGAVDISDPVRLLGHLFLGWETPPQPFGQCGSDPTSDDLDCKAFAECP